MLRDYMRKPGAKERNTQGDCRFCEIIKKIFYELKKVFPKVFILRLCVPSFHCGEYSFLVGSKKIDLRKVKIEKKFKNAEILCVDDFPEIVPYNGLGQMWHPMACSHTY